MELVKDCNAKDSIINFQIRASKKLKNSFKKKDKAWLKNLVDDDASLATKRILLSKLMEENHTHISQELATIRFGGKIFMRF